MKKYELVVIINPALEETARTELLASIRSELDAAKVANLSEDTWGSRKMAYKINGSIEGFYVLYTFESAGKHENVRKFFNLKKDIWRHMFVNIED